MQTQANFFLRRAQKPFTKKNICSIMKENGTGGEGGMRVPARQESCCFTGHRPAKLPWRYNESDLRCAALKRRIMDAVEAAYEEGYRHFLCGMAMGCDFYFCECVLALRQKHGDVTLEAAVPCPTQAETWPYAQQARYRRLVQSCDFETVNSTEYSPSCMQRRDRYMVDHSALLIAAFDGTAGGTRYTVEYAMRRGLDIVDVAIGG